MFFQIRLGFPFQRKARNEDIFPERKFTSVENHFNNTNFFESVNSPAFKI